MAILIDQALGNGAEKETPSALKSGISSLLVRAALQIFGRQEIL